MTSQENVQDYITSNNKNSAIALLRLTSRAHCVPSGSRLALSSSLSKYIPHDYRWNLQFVFPPLRSEALLTSP